MKRHRTCRILLPQITTLLLCRQNLCLFSWRLQPKVLTVFHDFWVENWELVARKQKTQFCLFEQSWRYRVVFFWLMFIFCFFIQNRVPVFSRSSQHRFCCRDIWQDLSILRLLSIHEFFCWLHRLFILCFYRASLPLCAFSEGRILLFLVRLERNGITSLLSFEGFCRKLRYHCLLLNITVFLRRCC